MGIEISGVSNLGVLGVHAGEAPAVAGEQPAFSAVDLANSGDGLTLLVQGGRPATPVSLQAALTREEITDKLRAIVAKNLDVEPDKIEEGSAFIQDLGADSLAIVELVLAIEENFGVDIPDEETEKIKTFGDAVNYLVANVPLAGV